VPEAQTLTELLKPIVADPARSAILLDVDGTLAPIVRHAEDAHVPESTRTLLIPIARKFGLVACVSGRRASDARRIVSLGTIAYLGSHGSEVLRPGNTQAELDRELAAWSRRVSRFAKDTESAELRRLRVRSEDKGVIAAFHWRGAPDEETAQIAVEGIARSAEKSGFHTHWGRKVLEVRPPVRIDKGAGVERLLRGADDIDAAIFVGDDATDVDAFRALTDLVEAGVLAHAVRVGVTSDEVPDSVTESADVLVDGTDGVREVLEHLLER
jgi:trehalose 6-phosphate phosphatase